MVMLHSSCPQSNIEVKNKMMKIKPVTVHYNFDDSICSFHQCFHLENGQYFMEFYYYKYFKINELF